MKPFSSHIQFFLVIGLVTAFIPIHSFAKEKTLWSHWYTITIKDKIPYGYYNETVNDRGDQIHVQTDLWKKEEGYINEEHLSAFSKNTTELWPVFYNFYSTYRSRETKIDGTMKNEKYLAVSVREGKKSKPLITQHLPKKTILSSFFPVFLNKNLDQLKKRKSLSFYSVSEDDRRSEFRPQPGRVTIATPDDFAKKSQTTRLSIRHSGVQSSWWIDSQGAAVRIQMPAQKVEVKRVSEKEAKAFLNP